jgi:hypothetical protein
MLSGDALPDHYLSGEPLPDEPLAENDEPDFEVEETALDELMKQILRRPKKPVFEADRYGLKGNYVVVQEISGNLRPGVNDKVRLVALRKEEGVFDRELLLEVAPAEGDPWLIPLSGDVRGYDSTIELKNFTSKVAPEVLLTVKTGRNEGSGRMLVVDVWHKEVLYDSKNTNLPMVQGRFFNGYRAEVFATDKERQWGSHILIDLSPRKKLYAKNRIYDEFSGQLLTLVRVRSVGHLRLAPEDVDGDGIYELKGIGDLRGAGRFDRVAYVDFTLKFVNGAWVLLACRIVPVEDLEQMPFPVKLSRVPAGALFCFRNYCTIN